MKKLLITAAVLALASTSANAWTTPGGHWVEGPTLYGPINRGAMYAPYGAPPAYFYGPPPPAVYGYPGYYAQPRVNFGIGPGGFFFGLGL